MIAVHDVLWCNPFLAGLDGDGHAVLVAATNKHNLFTLRAQIADIDIGRHIHPSQMSDVHRPVSIGQCRSYCITFVFLVFFAVCHVILFLVTIGDIQVTAYPGGIVLVVVLVNVFFVALNRLVVDVGGLAHHRYPH